MGGLKCLSCGFSLLGHSVCQNCGLKVDINSSSVYFKKETRERSAERINLLSVALEDALRSFEGDGRLIDGERIAQWKRILKENG